MKLMDAEPTLSAFRQGNQHRGRGGTTGGRGGTHRGRGGQLSHRPNNTPRTNKYCRLCHKCEMPREIYTGHNIGDARCTQLSFQDRQKLTQSSTLGSIVVQNDDDGVTELAASFGYDEHLVDQSTDQVNIHEEEIDNEILDKNLSRINLAKLCYIKPEPSQILTVFREESNTLPVHIDLDSGATLNYIRQKEAFMFAFKILPNGQLSTLGDGVTKIGSIGEIDVCFFRNNMKLRFRAVVCKDLQSAFIGGTVFMKDNRIEQNLSKGIIHLNDRKVTVPQTDFLSILPIQPITTPPNSSLSAASAQTEDLLPSSQKNESPSAQTEKPVPLISNSQMNDVLISNSQTNDVLISPSQTNDVLISPSQTNDVLISPSQKNHDTPMKTIMVKCKTTKVILPGQDLHQDVDIPNDTVVANEPWEQNKHCDWPTAQLCTVRNGVIRIKNYSTDSVILGKDVLLYKVRPTVEKTEDHDPEENSYYKFPEPCLKSMATKVTTFSDEIKFGEHIKCDAKELLNNAHTTYADVFNKDLTNGYNDFYGKHRCQLNWASRERPPATG